jgi:hypothetical protein
MIYNLLYRRHIGHIDLHKVLIINDLYIILCVLCAYVFKKKYSLRFTQKQAFQKNQGDENQA